MRVLFVVYDNQAYVHWFPQGQAYLAAVLRQADHEVAVYNQDIHHYPDDHLTAFLDREPPFDVVGIGVIGGYWQYRRLLALSRAIEKSKQRPPLFVLGGHGPSPEPGYFLDKTGADVVVIGEGEQTIIELLDAVEAKRPLSGVQGIAFKDGNEVTMTPERPLIADLDSIPTPAYDLFPMEVYRMLRLPGGATPNHRFVMPLLSGRGCTFKCTFCYRMDKGFRPRSAEAIIDEYQMLRRDYRVHDINFSDELLMVSEERTVELCEAFLAAGLDFEWGCNGRLNYAKKPLLDLMRRAGCVFINYGIEAMDDDTLRLMKKGLKVSQIIPAIEATLAAGINPGFNIIFGNLGDSQETLDRGVEFLLKYDNGAEMRTIRPVTPYPGSPLYEHAIEKGLLKDCADFYENKHVNSDLLAVNFTDMSDDDFHEALCQANTRLLENHFEMKLKSLISQTETLYRGRDASFRGFRHT